MNTITIVEDVVRVTEQGPDTVVAIIEPYALVVETGVAGPQGPQGEQGPQGPAGQATVNSGLLVDRPVSGDTEGELYAATDADDLYIWFE